MLCLFLKKEIAIVWLWSQMFAFDIFAQGSMKIIWYHSVLQGHGFRADLVSMLENLKPRYIRFPGFALNSLRTSIAIGLFLKLRLWRLLLVTWNATFVHDNYVEFCGTEVLFTNPNPYSSTTWYLGNFSW